MTGEVQSVLSNKSLRGFGDAETAESDMKQTSTIFPDESLPPLLKFLSIGECLLFSEASQEDSFASSPLRCLSFSDIEKGEWSPLSSTYDKMRSWSLRETFLTESETAPWACHSERLSANDMRNSSRIIETEKKKAFKCNLPKFGFGRSKVAPAYPGFNVESPNNMYAGKERSKAMGCKKFQQKRRTRPREKFFSQPNPGLRSDYSPTSREAHRHSGPLPGNLQSHSRSKIEDYSVFKTKATKLDRPPSRLNSSCPQDVQGQRGIHGNESALPTVQNVMPAGRYFDALKGPELDILRDSEGTVLPVDKKWPFLLRFPIGCFGICLGLGSQTILWKTLASAASMHFMHVPKVINLTLWCLALMALLTIFTTYFLKSVYYFEAVRREFYHPVRINFFFAPWIACMFLTLGVPPAVTRSAHPILCVLFMAPIFALELKIYGQWLSGGERRLSKVANPSTHLSLVGNFVGALLAATIGWKEMATFFWAVGLAHYLVLFVTLYQRLPTAAALPKELHPVFFLFVAAPSTASVAWSKIVGDFDFVSRIAYFVGLFLYSSLVVRLNFFRGFRFSIAWWAYTFPMTSSAIATIHYSLKVKHPITQGLAVLLSLISSITVLSLCCSTVLHIFWRSMFPNDMAIAITNESYTVKRKIKELNEDHTSSQSSPESLLHGESNASRECKVELHLPSVLSNPFPTNQTSLCGYKKHRTTEC